MEEVELGAVSGWDVMVKSSEACVLVRRKKCKHGYLVDQRGNLLVVLQYPSPFRNIRTSIYLRAHPK